MAYTKQTWVDRDTEFPNRRRLVEVSQGVYDITRQQGTVTAEGTPITAARLNHMEDGIYAKQDAITSSNKLPYAYLSDVPTVLPNPQPLTFGNKSYDGSSAQVLVPADIGLGTVFNLKGSKATVSDLPSSGNAIGDVWYVIAEHVGYIWLNDGTARWEQLGLPVDLSGYAEIDGTYPDMAVGYAEHAEEADSAAYADQLDSTVALTISTPFLFRPAAGGADVEGYLDSRAKIGAIYGNTVVSDGQLVHFTGTGIRSVGFNQWDEQIMPNQTITTQGVAGERRGYYRSKNYIPVIGGMRYHFCVKPTPTVGQKTIAIWTYDSDKVPLRSYDGIAVTNKDVLFDANVAYIRLYSNQGVDNPRYENNITINLKWSGYRDGEYEPYHTETKALPVSTYFPDGMKSAGTVRDELTRDKAIGRCGVRAYQSGDETNPSVTTDGINTVYALAEPVETVIDPPLDLIYRSSDYGTEMLLPETGTAPMTADISYVQNLRDKLQRMPMSPEKPGDYVVRYNGVNQIYIPLLDALFVPKETTDWKQVQFIVRNGYAPDVFNVGEQLTSRRGDTVLVWDILGFDHDTPADNRYTHSMTLQLHDCLQTLQYDAKEAFYYATEALAAGTYNFTVGAHTWVASEVGKTYQFTLNSELPAGGQIFFQNSYNAAFANAKVSTYASGSALEKIEEAVMTLGTAGTSLGTITNAINGDLNSCQRALLGSNNWKESAMRQFLNSDKAAGAVWTPQTKWDRPPSWVSSTAGFMNSMDADFLSVIGKTSKTTTQNTVCENGSAIVTEDKFFFLSRSEIYAGQEQSQVDEGLPYPYYSDYSDHDAPSMSADINRIKYLNGNPQHWWIRTTYVMFGSNVRYVYDTGGLSSYGSGAINAFGVAPACNII